MSEQTLSGLTGSVNEEWKSVCEGWYEVSNMGRVRRVRAGIGAIPGRLIKPCINEKGYCFFTATLDGRRSNPKIHRLVAEAFIGPRPDGMEINHLDGNKRNNAVTNLEYVTRSENYLHAYAIGLR